MGLPPYSATIQAQAPIKTKRHTYPLTSTTDNVVHSQGRIFTQYNTPNSFPPSQPHLVKAAATAQNLRTIPIFPHQVTQEKYPSCNKTPLFSRMKTHTINTPAPSPPSAAWSSTRPHTPHTVQYTPTHTFQHPLSLLKPPIHDSPPSSLKPPLFIKPPPLH